MKIGPFVFVATIVALGGCLPPKDEVATSAAPGATAPVTVPGRAPGAGTTAPGSPPPLDRQGNAPAGAMGSGLPPPSVSAADLDTLKAEVVRREKAADDKGTAEAKIALATATMGSGLPPTQMYPTALRLFREASKLDPSNAKAKEWIGMIEGIYKQMKRPVPK